ncbi:ParB N-terminal domain-containing protein [Calothrix rhizosoleniae]|uniref:ParB N-terminal domain-containing protein n=1 Tax=Calothrix rhizosoleniae TaxID=888997 RepID=UPI000B497D93|nr:ParB N-terminal domain-containing protein [Calothrix rhizosoleniae]
MKLLTSLVAVRKITCNSPRSLFIDEELEEAAKLILATEGVINPIVVRRTSLKSYEVIDGAFEYYAAARAREIEPEKGEMIGVFIIEEDNEELLIQQVKAFRKDNLNPVNKSIITEEVLNNFLKNFESRFDKIAHQLLEEATAKVKFEYEVKDLQKQLKNKIEILEIFNNLDASQLASKLKITGIKQFNQISDAVITERKKHKFKSLNDVVNRVKIKRGQKSITAISSKKMLDIVDIWLNNS